MRVNGQVVPSDPNVIMASAIRKKIVIVVCAYNGRSLDFPILLALLKKLDKCSQFSDQVYGLLDTMSTCIFRKLFPISSLKRVDFASSVQGVARIGCVIFLHKKW